MKKPVVILLIILVLSSIVGTLVYLKKRLNSSVTPTPTEEVEQDLPINTIPVSERPFITLMPDSTGRSLDFRVSGAPKTGELEYELVYQTIEVEEGVFGRLILDTETQPITKSLLLGSKSAGGKVTYHEGVKSGSVTVTYGNTRLMENFNYLAFNPEDPTILTPDGRLTITLPKNALKKDTRVLLMKSFGYEKAGFPESAKLIVGPYSIGYASHPSGEQSVEIKLPAGEYSNPTVYGWDGKSWKKLISKITADSLITKVSSQAYLVVAD